MSAFDEMLPGSFRGVRFYITSSTVIGGRKVSVKQFLNSDKQSIEDLGLKPRSYTMDVVILSSDRVSDYLAKKQEFLQALERPGSSILVHPFFGRISNMKVIDYTLNERLNNLGVPEFTITFGPDDSTGVPTVSQNRISRINNQSGIVSKFILTEFGDRYEVSRRYPRNFTSAQDKLVSVAGAFSRNASFSTALPSQINGFSSLLTLFSQDINELVNRPAELASRVIALFLSASNLYDSLESSYEVMKKFFSFGQETTPIQPTTLGLKERELNDRMVNYLIRVQALILAYQISSQEDYLTVDDVDRRANELEESYQDIKTNSGLSSETLEELAVLRDVVQVFFDNEKLTSKQIISVEIPSLSSVRLASYQYYGSTENSDIITGINGDLNVSFISGNVEILTE